jgi:hypothetical protein
MDDNDTISVVPAYKQLRIVPLSLKNQWLCYKNHVLKRILISVVTTWIDLDCDLDSVLD